jgi:hypothetical protein
LTLPFEVCEEGVPHLVDPPWPLKKNSVGARRPGAMAKCQRPLCGKHVPVYEDSDPAKVQLVGRAAELVAQFAADAAAAADLERRRLEQVPS